MLTFKEINGHNRKVYSLYRRSFPIVERAPVHFLQTRANKGKGKFLGIYDGKKFVGMTYLVIYGDIVFIFYLAINEKHRGGGYGTRILSELKEKYRDYRIILNIEELDETAPNYKERVRRFTSMKRTDTGFSDIPYVKSATTMKCSVAESLFHAKNIMSL